MSWTASAAGRVDPSDTAAVGSLARLREDCRIAKERLSAETVTELVAELPGYRSSIRVTRAELEHARRGMNRDRIRGRDGV